MGRFEVENAKYCEFMAGLPEFHGPIIICQKENYCLYEMIVQPLLGYEILFFFFPFFEHN